MPLYYVWSSRKCGKERKFSSIDGKVLSFFGCLGVGDIVWVSWGNQNAIEYDRGNHNTIIYDIKRISNILSSFLGIQIEPN